MVCFEVCCCVVLVFGWACGVSCGVTLDIPGFWLVICCA